MKTTEVIDWLIEIWWLFKLYIYLVIIIMQNMTTWKVRIAGDLAHIKLNNVSWVVCKQNKCK